MKYVNIQIINDSNILIGFTTMYAKSTLDCVSNNIALIAKRSEQYHKEGTK